MRIPAILALALVLGLTLRPAAAAVGGGDKAARFVETLGDRAIEILSSGAESEDAREESLRSLLSDGFGTDRMSQALLGGGWARASASQQAAFRDAFEAYLVAHITRVLKEESPEDFEVRDTRALSDGQTSVTTGVKRFGIALAEVVWVVRDTGPGFEVVDVRVDGVSLMETYRSEFRSLAQSQGMDALTTALEAKVARR